MSPDKIKAMRQGLKLSQQELADTIGVSVRTITNWEKGDSKPMRVFEGKLEYLYRRYVKEIGQ